MKTWIALIYIGFFAVIAVACVASKSAWPLIGLFFAPSTNGDEIQF